MKFKVGDSIMWKFGTWHCGKIIDIGEKYYIICPLDESNYEYNIQAVLKSHPTIRKFDAKHYEDEKAKSEYDPMG